jgi:hypothetical protein
MSCIVTGRVDAFKPEDFFPDAVTFASSSGGPPLPLLGFTT